MLPLSPQEEALLCALVQANGRVSTWRSLRRATASQGVNGGRRVIVKAVHRIRVKRPDLRISAVKGLGYRLGDPPPVPPVPWVAIIGAVVVGGVLARLNARRGALPENFPVHARPLAAVE